MRIAVLIPCLNEGETVGSVVNDFFLWLPEAEVFVIDNGSDDDTALKAVFAGASVIFEGKKGKGNALKRAFEKVKADYYIVVDGDGTYPVSEVRRLLSAAEGSDMVIGVRVCTGKRSLFRGLGAKFLTFVFNRFYRTNIKDVFSGYRVLSGDLVRKLRIECGDFRVETELTAKAVILGARIVQVEIPYRDRLEGEGKSKLNPLIDGFKILYEIFRRRFSYERGQIRIGELETRLKLQELDSFRP